MDIADAFELVVELAKQNILPSSDAYEDGALHDEREKQLEAIRLVEDFVVNQLGDD